MKQKHLDFMFEVANAAVKMSYATRLQVGAVVFKDSRILSTGYNGTPNGADNCCEYKEYSRYAPGGIDLATFEPVSVETLISSFPLQDSKGFYYRLTTKPDVIHAELNAIAFMAKHGVSTDGCSIAINISPCWECAKLIIQSGIKEVYYETEYRDTSAIKFLEDNGVKVIKYERLEDNTSF